jgi:hypothetical protein
MKAMCSAGCDWETVEYSTGCDTQHATKSMTLVPPPCFTSYGHINALSKIDEHILLRTAGFIFQCKVT